MNNLTRKRNWLITFLCTMALCLCFAFGITLNKPTVNADAQIKTYTVKIDDTVRATGERAIVNLRAPGEGATKIYMRYTVKEMSGIPARVGMVAGDFAARSGGGVGAFRILIPSLSWYFDETNVSGYIAQGNTYEIAYNVGDKGANSVAFDNNVKVTAADGTASTYQYGGMWSTAANGTSNGSAYYDCGTARYFGFYYSSITDKQWKATLEVSCYDDLGNDLGIAYNGYANIQSNVANNTQTLTTADDAILGDSDTTAANGSWYSVMGSGLDASRVQVLADDSFAKSKGANGAVIKMQTNDGASSRGLYGFSVGFPKALPKAEVDAGAELVIRAYALATSDHLKYSLISALDVASIAGNDTKVMSLITSKAAYLQGSGTLTAPGFTNVRVSNDYVKTLAVADGSVPGIQFAVHGQYGGSFYVDSVSYITGAQATAVDTLIADINAIGDVTKESATAIANAREAYDALPAEAQVLVTNYATLTAAETALEALKVSVTINNGTETHTNKVFVGTQAAAPALQNNGKIFLGWDFNGTLIAPATVITVEGDTTLTAVWVDYTQTVGASIRLNNTVEQSGIRFETVLTKATYEAYGDYIKAIGTIVLPTDLVDEAFTLEDTDAPNNYVLEKANFEFGEDDMLRLNAGLITINQNNYQREFSARSYMIVNYGGEDVVIYGDYNADDNARSVYEVATLALQDSASYSANEIAILQGYVQTATPTGVEVVVSSKEIELWA